ncbi:MAG: hypothetical protein NVSMB26_20710 [Beijerinckiaceae bacterium]
MLDRRGFLTVLSVSGILSLGSAALAKGPHKHMNGHDALGAKLKQNGKHEVGKAGKETVVAEVSNGKVVNMSAGSLPIKKVKTKKKMARLDLGKIKVAASGDILLAQATEVYYYGYGIDTGTEEIYYWYPATDVVITETWVEYTPV